MSSQPLVLAIEPDLRQAAIVKRIVREQVRADVAVVDSRDAAIEAMRTCMPDVLLLSALLSPRDEDELIAHLKTLEHAGHLQTHTIPQLASALQPGEGRAARGLLSAFRRKKEPAQAAGCDPDLFAEEIRMFLQRAAQKRRELQDRNHAAPDMRPSPASAAKASATLDGGAPAPQASCWSSPFEWKPNASSSRGIPDPVSPIADPASLIAHPASTIPGPESPIPGPESPIPVPESPIPISESLILAAPPAADSRSRIRDKRSTVKDSGLGIRDHRSTIRDEGLSALGVWMRRESDAFDRQEGQVSAGDVRAFLSTLAVPVAVASVSYPRGCRIRRVRVPPMPESESSDTAGAVIAGRRATPDHRDRHPS